MNLQAKLTFLCIPLLLGCGPGTCDSSGSGGSLNGGDKLRFSPDSAFIYDFAADVSVFRYTPGTEPSVTASRRYQSPLRGRSTFHPSGRFVFNGRFHADAPDLILDMVATLRVDPGTGALAEITSIAVPRQGSVEDLDVSPDGRFLYAAVAGGNSKGRTLVYAINAESGQLTQVQSLKTDMWSNAIRIRPDGKWLYHLGAKEQRMDVLRINPDDGTVSLVNTVTLPRLVTDIEFDSTGKILYLGNVQEPYGLTVYRLDDAGSVTPIQTVLLDTSDLLTGLKNDDESKLESAVLLASSNDGRFVYALKPCRRAIFLLSVNADGTLSVVERYEDAYDRDQPCGRRAYHLTISPDGKTLIGKMRHDASSISVLLYAIDPATGRLRWLGPRDWRG